MTHDPPVAGTSTASHRSSNLNRPELSLTKCSRRTSRRRDLHQRLPWLAIRCASLSREIPEPSDSPARHQIHHRDACRPLLLNRQYFRLRNLERIRAQLGVPFEL